MSKYVCTYVKNYSWFSYNKRASHYNCIPIFGNWCLKLKLRQIAFRKWFILHKFEFMGQTIEDNTCMGNSNLFLFSGDSLQKMKYVIITMRVREENWRGGDRQTEKVCWSKGVFYSQWSPSLPDITQFLPIPNRNEFEKGPSSQAIQFWRRYLWHDFFIKMELNIIAFCIQF